MCLQFCNVGTELRLYFHEESAAANFPTHALTVAHTRTLCPHALALTHARTHVSSTHGRTLLSKDYGMCSPLHLGLSFPQGPAFDVMLKPVDPLLLHLLPPDIDVL